jgi:hypothetical protein
MCGLRSSAHTADKGLKPAASTRRVFLLDTAGAESCCGRPRLASRRRGRNLPRKSGGPPPFALSLKVQRNVTHKSIRVEVLPRWYNLNTQRPPKGPKSARGEFSDGRPSDGNDRPAIQSPPAKPVPAGFLESGIRWCRLKSGPAKTNRGIS